MAVRECDCKEFQDVGHTDECNEHYKPKFGLLPVCNSCQKPLTGRSKSEDRCWCDTVGNWGMRPMLLEKQEHPSRDTNTVVNEK